MNIKNSSQQVLHPILGNTTQKINSDNQGINLINAKGAFSAV